MAGFAWVSIEFQVCFICIAHLKTASMADNTVSHDTREINRYLLHKKHFLVLSMLKIIVLPIMFLKIKIHFFKDSLINKNFKLTALI